MAVMKVIEVLSESKESWEDAAAKGIAKAGESVKGLKSAFVQSQSITINSKGKVDKYRVNLKITFEVN